MISKKSVFSIAVLMLGFAVLQTAWAAAGSIVLASGQVFILDAQGARRAATVGMPIESGETLVTQDGRAQIKFTDGGQVSLQPASEFKITDYKFQDASKAADSAIFGFIKGGLRAITGLIGHVDRPAYRMDSIVATIGIRGTEFKAILCDKSCKEPDGLYVQTGEGIVSVKNAFGEVEIGPGETAYVPSPNDPPRRTSQAPTITAQPSVSQPPPIAGIGTGSEFQPGTIMSSNNIGEVTPITSGGLGLAISGTGTVTSSTSNRSWSGSGAGSGAEAVILSAADAALGIGGVYLVDGELRGAVIKMNDGQFGSIILDRPTNAGSEGNLYWGRWVNPKISLFASLSGYVGTETLDVSGTNLHYILGTSVPTIPTTGSATYGFIGGTPSTDQAGGVGSGITSGTLTAYFFSNNVSANFAVSHGGTYKVTASMPMSHNRSSFSGTGSAGGYTANVSGFFAGTNAPTAPSRAGITYDIKTGNPIAGVGAFRCSSGC